MDRARRRSVGRSVSDADRTSTCSVRENRSRLAGLQLCDRRCRLSPDRCSHHRSSSTSRCRINGMGVHLSRDRNVRVTGELRHFSQRNPSRQHMANPAVAQAVGVHRGTPNRVRASSRPGPLCAPAVSGMSDRFSARSDRVPPPSCANLAQARSGAGVDNLSGLVEGLYV